MTPSHFGSSLLQQSVSRIVIDSRLLPQVVIDDPFGPSPVAAPGMGAALLGLLRPRATLTTMAGEVQIAPYGDPGETNYWPAVVLAGTALAAYLSYRILRP